MTKPMSNNEHIIRDLYASAEANTKDTPHFVSLFAEDGYFWDVAAGMKYYGSDVGTPVDNYDSAFPDMHRELFNLYEVGDTIIVELSLNGTHLADLQLPGGYIPATGKRIETPCCDVFQLKDGKVVSFHCYVAVPVLLQQIGVFLNLEAALKH